MKESYSNILKVSIGKVLAKTIIDNYFPIVGQDIRIDATTKWGQTSEWQIQNGDGHTTTVTGNLLHDKDSQTVTITGTGELQQKFTGKNFAFSTDVLKTVYAMTTQNLPYFDIKVSNEIIRTDNEISRIMIYPENGYTGAHTVIARIYKENEWMPAFTFTNTMQDDGFEYVDFFVSQATERGIYDLEIDVIDTATGKMFSKRINKIITVTPRLANEPADRESGYRDILATTAYTTYSGKIKINFYIRLWENTGNGLSYAELAIPSGEQNGTCYYDAIDISVLPAGTTLVLLNDPNEPDPGYARRLLFKGNNPISISNENGTPNFTWENPLIITINQNFPYEVPFCYYGGVSFDNNCRNIVIDGRGYKNISKGIHVHRYSLDLFAETCVFLTNGTAEIELLELELSDCDFTGIMAKTDPDPSRPWFWFGNWEMDNLLLHHCHIHDTLGEGFYIGYFTPETRTGTNSDGETVQYRAHALTNTRIYRLLLENNGYDGMQLSNARGAEVCYNELYNAAWRGEKDQASGMSIQSISGKCYNNIIHKFNGPGLQIGPLGDLDVFNNIVYDCPSGQPGIQFLFMKDCPEQNPNGDDTNDIIKMYVHNNVILCNGVGVNGRNTVQMTGLYFEDNIIVYKDALFGNMTNATIAQWESQASGNLALNRKVIDFVELDSYKIADSANGNFQIAADSELIQTGSGNNFHFDFRGYKNWFGTVAPTGSFLGKYKSDSINDDPITLVSISINDGVSSTREQIVSVKLTYTGAATRYRISESSDMESATWQDIPAENIVEYKLSDGFGEKTIYAQVAAGSMDSDIVSATIDYQSTPLTLEALILNDGKAISRYLTIPVAFIYSGSFEPAKYRLDELPDMSNSEWLDIVEDITYIFDSLGQKILYGQLQDSEGNLTEIKSAGITIEQTAKKAIISIGWNNSDVPSATEGYYDPSTGITKFQSQAAISTPRNIYDTFGEILGTAVPSANSSNMISSSGTKGYTTGNDSGIYPDSYLEHNSVYGGNKIGNESITFTLPSGSYKIRLLCNTLWETRLIPNESLMYKAVTDIDETMFVLPESGVQKNTQYMTEYVTVTVGDSGMLRIDFGVGIDGTYYYAPLNVIEIEEV